MSSMTKLKRVLYRVVPAPKEELEVTEIITGQPLSDVPLVMEIERMNAKVRYISDPRLAGRDPRFIKARPLHLQEPLSSIADPLGLEIWVKFYEINNLPVYFVEEPPVNDLVKRIYVYLKTRIGEVGIKGGIMSVFKSAFDDLGIDPTYALGEEDVKSAIYYVWRDLLGYGPVEAPMEDNQIEEISWYGYDYPVQVVDKEVQKKYPNAEFIYTNIFMPIDLEDEKKKFFLTQITRSITSRARAGLTTAKPYAETRIPDPTLRGFHRLASHLDVISRTSAFTIRKFPKIKLSLTQLIDSNTISELEAAYLLYQLINRGFILIVGHMGSGKTTLLQALISALPVTYKVVTIEDTPELSTPAHNWHPLYVRRAPKETELEDVSYSKLVMHSLRHRGTIVTLGEVRGKEMSDLIQAAASGHGAICLRPDSKLLVRIGSNVRLMDMREVVDGFSTNQFEVLSFNEQRGVLEWKPVTNVIKVNTTEWVRVETVSGRRLDMTPDHRLLVRDTRGRVVVKYASDISVGDRLLVPSKLPRVKPLKHHVIVSGVYVDLDKSLGRFIGLLLTGRKYSNRISVKKNEENISLLQIPLGLKIRVIKGKKRLTLTGTDLYRLLDGVKSLIKKHPLSLPKHFIEGVYEVSIKKGLIIDEDVDFLHGLHYALKTIGVDSVVKEGKLKILEKHDDGIIEDTIAIIDILKPEEPEQAYDIEVGDNHTFITDNSVVSMNCTFHAHDPFSVLTRITSSPINAAPESLKLITSILHISATKKFEKGRPVPVRRVMKIFEIEDVKGINVVSTVTFKWIPTSDTHLPSIYSLSERRLVDNILDPLAELWTKSRVVRMLGEDIYGEVEPERALMDILSIALFLREQTNRQVYSIRQLLFNMTSFYLRLDLMSQKLWNILKEPLRKRIEEVSTSSSINTS